MASSAVLKVYARYALVDARLRRDEPALLLEGSWPSGDGQLRWSLDDSIDASQAWIDEEASRVANELARVAADGGLAGIGLEDERRTSNVQRPTSNEGGVPSLLDVRRWTLDVGRSASSRPGLAYLNELKLRYYLVKLLRVVAFFDLGQTLSSARHAEKRDPVLHGGIELIAARGRDEDYAELLRAIGVAHGWPVVVSWRDADSVPPARQPRNRWWRRAAGAISGWARPSWPADNAPRVVLCGSRRVLGEMCNELIRRGAHVAWLYDRFAVHTWLRWRRSGVVQLMCNTGDLKPGRTDVQSVPRAAGLGLLGARLLCHGIDLSAPILHWLARIEQERGAQQARLSQAIDGHFARLRPTALVLDEDATPMARAAVAAARRRGVPSVVVQHGAPRVKFGFAPLAADYVFAWGESSQRQFLRWGVPPECIQVVGRTDFHSVQTSNVQRPTSNVEQGDMASATRRQAPEILLFGTTPPRDDRPDAVSFHLTGRTHRQMLWMACAAVASIPGARLTIKLHPRCSDARPYRAAAAEFPQLRSRIVRRGSLQQLVRRAACVINVTSSAGIEAAALGAKVIDLAPAGSLDLLPSHEWNTLGTARSEPELRRLLHVALNDSALNDSPAESTVGVSHRADVFAAVGREAARRAVDELGSVRCADQVRRGIHLPRMVRTADPIQWQAPRHP